jgi:competence protein ComGC
VLKRAEDIKAKAQAHIADLTAERIMAYRNLNHATSSRQIEKLKSAIEKITGYIERQQQICDTANRHQDIPLKEQLVLCDLLDGLFHCGNQVKRRVRQDPGF